MRWPRNGVTTCTAAHLLNGEPLYLAYSVTCDLNILLKVFVHRPVSYIPDSDLDSINSLDDVANYFSTLQSLGRCGLQLMVEEQIVSLGTKNDKYREDFLMRHWIEVRFMECNIYCLP